MKARSGRWERSMSLRMCTWAFIPSMFHVRAVRCLLVASVGVTELSGHGSLNRLEMRGHSHQQ